MKKKLLVTATALILACTMPVSVGAVQDDVLRGDFYKDGVVGILDLGEMLRYIAGYDIPDYIVESISFENADANEDGKFNLKDVARVIKDHYPDGIDINNLEIFVEEFD